jgi:hypothetical protein
MVIALGLNSAGNKFPGPSQQMQKAMLKSMNIAFCFGCEMNEWSVGILTELK